MLERTFYLGKPLNLRHTLGLLQHGLGDPCVRFQDGRFWMASRNPDGGSTLMLDVRGLELTARSWGDGGQWALNQIPELIGENRQSLVTDHPVVGPMVHQHPGMRVPRTANVFESCFPAVLEQRVTTMEAYRSYRQIVRRYGEPAPGPAGDQGLYLQPEPSTVARLPSWALHPFGVDRQRAETLRRVAQSARRLQEATTMTPVAGLNRLKVVPGVGQWTAAETAYRALGHGDAVSVGDYHFKDWVSWALAREPRGSDERMLELLSPFAGNRGQVIRLIGASGLRPPKWGPKYSPLPIASF